MKEKKDKKRSKKFDYFDAFSRMAECSVEAAKLLNDTLNNYNLAENFTTRIPDMRRIEHASDEIVYEIMNYVATDFITPIDREDIIDITQGLDSVVDAIDDIFSYMYMYHVNVLRPDVLDMTDNILKCTKALRRLCEEFPDMGKAKHFKEKVIVVNELEKDSDALLMKALYTIFGDDNMSGRDLLIWRDMYERLEVCSDKCEEVTNLMESAVLENS
jgi:uncharacterized protein Yka (UPF0111/DUF47 family)